LDPKYDTTKFTINDPKLTITDPFLEHSKNYRYRTCIKKRERIGIQYRHSNTS